MCQSTSQQCVRAATRESKHLFACRPSSVQLSHRCSAVNHIASLICIVTSVDGRVFYLQLAAHERRGRKRGSRTMTSGRKKSISTAMDKYETATVIVLTQIVFYENLLILPFFPVACSGHLVFVCVASVRTCTRIKSPTWHAASPAELFGDSL